MTPANILAEFLTATTGAAQQVKPAEGSRFRASGALSCHRARCLDALGVEPSNPGTGLRLMPLAVGSSLHGLVEAAYAFHYGDGFQAERLVDFRPEVDLSGHCDGWIAATGTVLEVKTMAPFAFDLATTGAITRNRVRLMAEGPKIEHIVQAGIYCLGLHGEQVELVYLNKGSGEVASWTFGWADPVPGGQTLAAAVAEEMSDIAELCDLLDRGQLADAYLPGVGLRRDPLPVDPQSRDQDWRCRLCRHRTTCASLPVKAVGVDFLRSRSHA